MLDGLICTIAGYFQIHTYFALFEAYSLKKSLLLANPPRACQAGCAATAALTFSSTSGLKKKKKKNNKEGVSRAQITKTCIER